MPSVCHMNLVPVTSSACVPLWQLLQGRSIPPPTSLDECIDKCRSAPTKSQVVVDRQMSIVIGHMCLYEWLCREAEKVSYFSVICAGNFKIEVWRLVEIHIVYLNVFCVLQEHCYMNQINVNLRLDSSIVGNAASSFRHQTRYVTLKLVMHVERACGDGRRWIIAKKFCNKSERLLNSLVIMMLAWNSRHSILWLCFILVTNSLVRFQWIFCSFTFSATELSLTHNHRSMADISHLTAVPLTSIPVRNGVW